MDVMLSPLLLHKSVTIIYLLLSESHHHLTPSNVTSKLTTLPHHNSHHLAATQHLWFIFLTLLRCQFLHYIFMFCSKEVIQRSLISNVIM